MKILYKFGAECTKEVLFGKFIAPWVQNERWFECCAGTTFVVLGAVKMNGVEYPLIEEARGEYKTRPDPLPTKVEDLWRPNPEEVERLAPLDFAKVTAFKAETNNREIVIDFESMTLTFEGSRGAYREEDRKIRELGMKLVKYETSIPAMRPEETFYDFCERLGGFPQSLDFMVVDHSYRVFYPGSIFYDQIYAGLKGRTEISPEEYADIRDKALAAHLAN